MESQISIIYDNSCAFAPDVFTDVMRIPSPLLSDNHPTDAVHSGMFESKGLL